MFSYRWADLITLASKQVKNIPTQPLDAMHCDLVSSRIASRLPWRSSLTTIADGQIQLVDGQQDYDPPFNIWRLIDASLRCTSVSPNDDVTVTVRDSLAVDLLRRSPYQISSCCLQAGDGRIRLSSAPAIPSGTTWELRGIYQINPTRVSSVNQNLWFDDRYVYAAIAGLKYYYFEMADDPRAGTASTTIEGTPTGYTGQLGEWMAAIKEMADAEDIGGDMQAMPDDPLGISQQYGTMFTMFGGGGAATGGGGSGGGGGGGGGGGIISINADTTPAQQIIGTGVVTVSTVNGVTTIFVAPALGSITLAPTSVVGGSSSIGTVTLSMPATAGVVVGLSSSNTAVAQVPASVTVPAGASSATFSVTTTPVGSNTTATISCSYGGATRTANLTITIPPQPIYGGPGAPGATSSVTLSGTHVTLSTGDILPQIQASQEQIGQSWSFSPNNQCVYMLLVGGNHTFVDGNNDTFVFNPPLACNVSGVTLYLYQSTYQLFGTYLVKIAT